jgi:hydrogenase-4 membrane subunit HyfE
VVRRVGVRSARRNRQVIDLGQIAIGDYVVLGAATLSLVSLFLPWFKTTIGPARTEWAFTYSQVASIVVLLVFLLTMFLVVYPAISPNAGLPPLPFSTPLPLLAMGFLLLLVTDYELGKYGCIQCQNTSRGYGVWLSIVSAVVYIFGSIIKWGTRPVRR